MKYFANLENNIVQKVIVAEQDFIDTLDGVWVETDRNGVSPKNFAGIGYTYDEERNAFIAPKPHPSSVLDEGELIWVAPIPYPNDGKLYRWDEDEVDWILIA